MSIEPRIIPRAEHTLSRASINPNALKVLYRLKGVGLQAYLVGGGVRDLLLGREPKDFDIATDGHPDEVKLHFRNSRLIGRRFRLAHVRFGRDVIEVATFRGQSAEGSNNGDMEIVDGRIIRDNVYGTLEEDAWRRDFTVNALYYNINDFSVVDYTGGLEDLKNGVLRIIGDPEQRYREDPVRMLRAVRFMAKLGFRMHPDTEAPLFELGHLLMHISPARLFEEFLKLFLGGCAVQTFELLRHYNVFQYLFPEMDELLAQEHDGFPHTLLVHAFTNTDARIAENKPVTPAFLFAALLWESMLALADQLQQEGLPEAQALQEASSTVVHRQMASVTLPKRFSVPMREIWQLQPRLLRNHGRRTLRVLSHPRFRAAYDFLLLRAQAGEDLQELADWWTQFQELTDKERETLLGTAGSKPQQRRSTRRRRKTHDQVH